MPAALSTHSDGKGCARISLVLDPEGDGLDVRKWFEAGYASPCVCKGGVGCASEAEQIKRSFHASPFMGLAASLYTCNHKDRHRAPHPFSPLDQNVIARPS